MNKDKLDLLIQRLELEAKGFEPLDEDFNAYDSSGGNFDDAFWQGYEYGSATFAVELLNFIKGE